MARKLTKKDREGASQLQTASRASAQNEESSLSDSDSDAPFVTSRRVDPSIFRPVPVVEIIQNASSRKPTSHAKPSSASSQHVPAKSKRAPTPSDPSESEAESESEVQESSARQAAAHARRFQRFAERDRSPEASSKRKSPGKKKTKTRADEGGATKRKPRIVRRQVEDLANDTSSPRLSKERKRKAKTIHTSDEEEEVPQGKRLKTYEEHQSQLMRQESVYSGQSSRDGSHISPVNNVHRSNDTMVNATTPSSYFSKDYAPFFVDVQKNVDNVLSLPSELDPWADIFEAADILNLDTLQDCIRKPENADEFVKWVLAVCVRFLR